MNPERAAPVRRPAVIHTRPAVLKYFVLPAAGSSIFASAMMKWSVGEATYSRRLLVSVAVGMIAGAAGYLWMYGLRRLALSRMAEDARLRLGDDPDPLEMLIALGNHPLPTPDAHARNDAEWRNERNWHLRHSTYIARRDSRFIVPKWTRNFDEGASLRDTPHQTLNLGHPTGMFTVALALLAPTVVLIAMWIALR